MEWSMEWNMEWDGTADCMCTMFYLHYLHTSFLLSAFTNINTLGGVHGGAAEEVLTESSWPFPGGLTPIFI